MRTARLCPILFALVLSACSGIEIPNTRVCAVAGKLAAGMDCAYTLSDQTESMTLDQAIDFLEPQPGDPSKGTQDRGPALCQSSADWTLLKTTLEQACRSLGRKCTKEIQSDIAMVAHRLEALKQKSLKKKKAPR